MGCDIHELVERKSPTYGWINSGCPDLNRDYELFSVLAGIRNSYNLKPISEPRGLPEDVCSEMKYNSEHWDSDGHSHSYVTLKELKEFDLNQEFHDDRLITSKDDSGKITSTCAWSSSPTLGVVGNRKVFSVWGAEHFNSLIAYMENVKSFHKIESDESVRLVFFFDN